MELQKQPVVVKDFVAETEMVATERYLADAVVATRLGYASTSQTWDGTKLTVVYELQTLEPDPSQPAPDDLSVTNAQANQERAAANAQANQERAEANARANEERAGSSPS